MPPRARTIVIDAVQRPRLEALARSRTAPLREVQRARIVLAAAAAAATGAGNAAIARDLSIEETTVRTWRGRFAGFPWGRLAFSQADLFVRLSEVDAGGRSHNITEGYRTPSPSDGPTTADHSKEPDPSRINPELH